MSEHVHNHSHSHAHGDGAAHVHNPDVHGEHCECGCGAEHGEHFEATKNEEKLRIIISAVFFAAGYILSETGLIKAPDYVYLCCFLVSYVAVGFSVVKQALLDIISGRLFGESFLIAAASLGAFAIHEYSEGCAVMLLYSIGEYIQGAALSKSRARITAMADEHGFEHSHSNSDAERFISRFAKIYTPVICLMAVIIIVVPPVLMHGDWHSSLHRGLSALVIGCPCAIVISVPLAFSCAIGACTRENIFVHCSDALERVWKKDEGAFEEIVIPDNSPEKQDFVKKAAKKAVAIARENIAFSIAVKAAVLVMVVFLNREVPMWLAEFSDVGVALLAIINSLRALRIK